MNRDQEIEDVREVMDLPAGRRLVWRVLGEARIFRSCFTGNSKTFFLEGKRDIGLFILREIMDICPERFGQMQAEATEYNFKEEAQNATDDGYESI